MISQTKIQQEIIKKEKLVIEELEKLCSKYEIMISTGCGCCGAGFYHTSSLIGVSQFFTDINGIG